MSDNKIIELRSRIKELTNELNGCVDELIILVDGKPSETGATEVDLGVHSQLSDLIGNRD
jgi:hypothetical protein